MPPLGGFSACWPRVCVASPGWGQEWLQLSHLRWSSPTEEVQGGLSQTNGDRWVWGPTEPLLHIWPHLVAPSAAPWGGHGVTLVGTKGVWALCTHGWRCCCWGHLPVPAVILQAGGGCGVTSACAMAASSSSLLPHLPRAGG